MERNLHHLKLNLTTVDKRNKSHSCARFTTVLFFVINFSWLFHLFPDSVFFFVFLQNPLEVLYFLKQNRKSQLICVIRLHSFQRKKFVSISKIDIAYVCTFVCESIYMYRYVYVHTYNISIHRYTYMHIWKYNHLIYIGNLHIHTNLHTYMCVYLCIDCEYVCVFLCRCVFIMCLCVCVNPYFRRNLSLCYKD